MASVCRDIGTISRASTMPALCRPLSPTARSRSRLLATKAMFFSENDAQGKRIDYEAAVSGGLQLVPVGAAHGVLSNDYARMLTDGMLLDENESFDELMDRCASIEARANNA